MKKRVGAVVLAAGMSRRMGTAKMVLPWAAHTVIEQVISVLVMAQIEPIRVVTGGSEDLVERALAGYRVDIIQNRSFEHSEMLRSLQCGLEGISDLLDASLVVLGDQPQIELETVARILNCYQNQNVDLVVPSFQNRRGHPWLVGRAYWPALISMPPEKSLRDFLNANSANIQYVNVDRPTVLKDLDTPEDYEAERPTS